jgi:hypothetical protein
MPLSLRACQKFGHIARLLNVKARGAQGQSQLPFAFKRMGIV